MILLRPSHNTNNNYNDDIVHVNSGWILMNCFGIKDTVFSLYLSLYLSLFVLMGSNVTG